MSIVRANTPIMHFEDDNGLALSGGILCTYVAGTSTPIATYKNKEGALNPTRIVLDSRGECDIWLDPSQSYKFVLKRADGSVVWTKDDITADAVYELPSRIVDTVEGSGDVDVTAVADGNSTKYVVKLNKTFAEETDLEKKIVTVYYNCGQGKPNSTYAEVSAAFYQDKNAVRLMTYIADKKVFVFNAEATEDSCVVFSGVYDGSLYEFKVSSSGWSVTSKSLASTSDVASVKDAFYFNDATTATAFQTAFNAKKVLIYEKVTSQGTSGTTRKFSLVKKEQRAGKPTMALLFACLDGETIYKVSMTYDMVAPSLTIGEITSYAVNDKDDELASTIASYQEATNESFRTMGTTLSQGLNQLEASKLSAVAHDATLEGDGTEANPLKVIGGGGGGIPEAPTDGKQYARKDGEWAEVEAGASSWEDISGKPSTFPPSSHTHTKSQITDLVVPTKVSELTNDSGFIDKATFTATYNTTTFADIASAVEDGYCVKCDMSGYTYELVQATTEKITFAATSNVSGTITQETVWVNRDDTWDSEGVNVAKSSDVKSKTSELTNDAGFLTDAPADGKQYCRKDNAWAEVIGGGGSEVGYTSTILWDYQENGGGVIKYGTNQNYTLNDSIENYDLLVVEVVSISSDITGGPSSTWYGTSQTIVSVEELKNALKPYYFHYTSYDDRSSRFHIEGTSFVCEESVIDCNGLVKLYGISLRVKSDVYSTDEVAIGKWIDGSTIYRKAVDITPIRWETGNVWKDISYYDSSIKLVTKCFVYMDYSGTSTPFTNVVPCKKDGNKLQLLYATSTSSYVYKVILEYTKNEG